MAISITDPIIHIRTPEGTTLVGLHEVFAYAYNGMLIDLVAARFDQRAPVVTALAIISHLLRRYARVQLSSPNLAKSAARAVWRSCARSLWRA
jgi:hypothetical protein